jgi:hypothetical protein
MRGLPLSQPEFLTVFNPDAARIHATHLQPFQTRLRKNLAKSDDRPHYPGLLTLLPVTHLFVSLCLLLLTLAAQPCASSSAIPVHVEPLAGSTGVTISILIENNLLASGTVALTARRSETVVVSGTVSGTRLEGRLTAPDGSELLRTLYDGPDLRWGAHELTADLRHVDFSCDEGKGAGPQLYEARPGHRSRRLPLGVSSAFSPDWAPDGERLVFVTQYRGVL